MPNLILHHYPMSPFSQKVRSLLGYAQLPWQSVIVREMPPRPLLLPLAGGYRKIPVAQDGADVFCDTRVIAEEIAARCGKPALVLANNTPAQQAFAARADLELFFACLVAGGNLTLGRKVLASMSLLDIARFFLDRVRMGRTAKVRVAGPRAAVPMVRAHLAQMEGMLSRGFLFGDEPVHADFSAWHSLWFLNDLAESPLPAAYPRVVDWMARLRAFGEGDPSPMSSEQAIHVARAATPRAIAAEHRQDARVGKTVSIAPADYGRDPTAGTLAGVTPTRYILARDTQEAGRVHVHFPQQGYVLQVMT